MHNTRVQYGYYDSHAYYIIIIIILALEYDGYSCMHTS